jgi:hypothetical protein
MNYLDWNNLFVKYLDNVKFEIASSCTLLAMAFGVRPLSLR